MLFKEISGHEELKKKLRGLVDENRLPHALMLYGPPGTGKRSLALALAQYLACGKREAGEACGLCPSCVQFGKLVHPDLHFVLPVTTSQKVSRDPLTKHFLDEWRQAFLENPYFSENQWYKYIGAENKQGAINVEEGKDLIQKIGYKPYESEYRMVFIWLPERMNRQVANKLLKQLEEPPGKTVILMVAESTEQILPTILSRTQLMLVPPLEDHFIREGILKHHSPESELLEDAISKANGNFNLALRTMGQDEADLENFGRFASLMRLCYSRKIIEIATWVDEAAGLGRERQKLLLDYSLGMLRENFMLHMKESKLTFLSSKELAFSKKFSPFIHRENIHELVDAFNEAALHIAANGNPRIIFMDLSVTVIKLLMRKPAAN